MGFFFTLIFAPMLMVILGLIFGNDPSPEFGGRGFVAATLPAYASLVVAIMGVLTLPVSQLQLRESGALLRLRATPLRPQSYVAADLTVNFLIGLTGIAFALMVGILGFGVRPEGNLVSVLAAAALGLVAFLALGYTLAAIYPSAAAATGIGNGLMILLMMTSGAFVPLAVLPEGVQRVTEFSPIRHLVDLMQGLWNGDPWSNYGLATAVLVGMIVIFGTMGARLFKWNAA
ncbi:ABC-2 type transport system permease protein [Rhodococcus coprophilus]|nr:ABC-2 type transport system permease protein [Rhodococcus coprophilus]